MESRTTRFNRLLPALYVQIQVMDTVLTSLIRTHPRPKVLKIAMKEDLEMLLRQRQQVTLHFGSHEEELIMYRNFISGQLLQIEQALRDQDH